MIVTQLYDLSQALRNEHGDLTSASLLVEQAARMIEIQPRLESERFLAHYNAALSALAAPCLEWDVLAVVDKARRLALLSMQVKYEA